MRRLVALFRGINVGGHHRLPMKELTGLLEGLGCRRVRTYIQSGNVTFETGEDDLARLAARISAAVADTRGFAPRVWLLDAKAFRAAVDNCPYPMDAGKAVHFFFLEEPAVDADLHGLAKLAADSESFELIDAVFYLHAPEGIGRSKLVEKLGRFIPVGMTARNGNTVAKLAQMLED